LAARCKRGYGGGARGFGVIGGFAHERVRLAAQAFVELCHQYRSEMTFVDLFPPPREGQLRVYALTEQRVFVAETTEAQLADKTPIAAIRAAGHAVIAELRQAGSKR
jgi:hypothetical protein